MACFDGLFSYQLGMYQVFVTQKGNWYYRLPRQQYKVAILAKGVSPGCHGFTRLA